MAGFVSEPEHRAQGPIVDAPFVVKAIILSLVIVHVIQLTGGDDYRVWMIFNFGLHPLQVIDQEGWVTAWLWFPAWTKMVTHAFLHADLTHLLLNSLWLLVFGTVVARRTGTWRFLLLFLVTAIAGGAAHVATHWGSMMPVIGASGAVSGLMGASFRFVLRGWNAPPGSPLLPLFSQTVLLAALAWSLVNFVLGTLGYTPDGLGVLVAWEAHMGGFLAGLILFPLFDRRGTFRP